MTTEFWLDGVKQESAQDVVGKDGVLTAQYTVSNLSTATYTVTVPDLDGNPVEVQQEAQQLYVGIAKTLLPQRYSGLNTPGGMGGADGRGNNQIQWIIVPTMPLNENGVKTFGWSAHVTDAVIPSILLQVQPVYHAPGHAEERGRRQWLRRKADQPSTLIRLWPRSRPGSPTSRPGCAHSRIAPCRKHRVRAARSMAYTPTMRWYVSTKP